MKLEIKPIDLKSIELQGIQERIQYLQRLQRQTKSEIKKLENPIKI
jgi:DNA polymerase I-like protein with 3'-5' exonuclease and polymerase domains